MIFESSTRLYRENMRSCAPELSTYLLLQIDFQINSVGLIDCDLFH